MVGVMRAHRVLGVLVTVLTLAGVGFLSFALRGSPEPTPTEESVLIAWISRGLPDGFGEAVSALEGVTAASVVRGDTVALAASWGADGQPVDQPPAGMAIPLDALAVDPVAHAGVVAGPGAAAIRALAPDEALLGASSAALRGLTAGAVLELAGGRRFTVAAVVPDDVVSHAEVLLRAPTRDVPTERFVRLVHRGQRAEVEAAIDAAGGDRAVQVRAAGELPVPRPGGTLLPQVRLKERFGEFALRPAGGRMVQQDPAWVDRAIRVTSVPILGEVACHAQVIPALQGAMTELVEAGLAALVDPSDYAGCYGPRLIAPGQGLSRHAWGIAVDLNASTNGYGDPPTQDPRLVGTMARWGFTWGGTWLVPDGMHFEYQHAPP